jgi:hypothetical protein
LIAADFSFAGLITTAAIYFFFFAAFLAFLFFAITDLREKLRKYSTGSVRTATDYSIRGTSPTNRILLSLGARSDLKRFWLYSFSLIFTNKTHFHQKNSRLVNFCRAALHILTKAARIISHLQRRDCAAPTLNLLRSSSLCATRKQYGIDIVAPRRRRARQRRQGTQTERQG